MQETQQDSITRHQQAKAKIRAERREKRDRWINTLLANEAERKATLKFWDAIDRMLDEDDEAEPSQ